MNLSRTLHGMMLLVAFVGAAHASTTLTVQPIQIADEKAVFATVESRNVVPARARIGGTVASLAVIQGQQVARSQIIAVVTDPKLQLQITALDAQIAGLQSQLAQAKIDLTRAQTLAKTGAGSRQTLDLAETAERVATSALSARIAERDVTRQLLNEGDVLAPTAGRVLDVPITNGSVVLAGDTLATIAEQNYVLRLSVPERHALFLKLGDSIRLDGKELGETGPAFGKITLIYPQIQDGRVRVEASATGIGDYFVGERIRVWVSAGTRSTIIVPSSFVHTRFGLDFVWLSQPGGQTIEIPVQRGRALPSAATPDGLEILSGLAPGEILVSQ
ncbi:MAG: efflux RND transporter periplasmic adaptor subunit [Rhodospirillales bacterium]|nr:efflux RND transporter periplasmic adaptor subunit [Rhodospirillales bacterium]